VSDRLFGEAHRFDFFQAVRLLHRLAAGPSGADAPARRPVGRDSAPREEAVRFRAFASHSFPTGAVSEIRRCPSPAGAARDGLPEMVTSFFGLTGPQGVLPQHYTTLLIERIRAKDYALRDLLDLFHHRAVSLFYRAWEKDRFAFAYEAGQMRGAERAEEDLFTSCLYCLLGLGTAGVRRRAEFDDEATLFYAGHFAHWPRSAVALEAILNDYFALPMAVNQFQGQWLTMAVEDRSSLPAPRRPEGQYARLGMDAVAGERIWDVEGKFRLRVGPLHYAEFRRLMPDGDMLLPLCQMARLYVGPHLELDVQLVLKGREAPWSRLGGEGGRSSSSAPPTPTEEGGEKKSCVPFSGSRLGWNAWVRSGEFGQDVSDAIFRSRA
jgi:type VI secretion system protein ImpH